MTTQDKYPNRTPPHSNDAEQALLGAMMISIPAIETAAESVSADRLYSPAHQIIFNAIIRLYNKQTSADITTIADEIETHDGAEILTNIGGRSYLADLASGVATGANAASYIEIILRDYKCRSMIETSMEIIDRCYRRDQDIDEIMDFAGQQIYDLSERRHAKGARHIGEIVPDAIFKIGEQKDNPTGLIGETTGFRDLDDATCGNVPGDLIILAGRPSMGKSALAYCMIDNFAVANQPDPNSDDPKRRKGKAAMLFTPEMSEEQVVMRALSAESGIDGRDLRRGRVNIEEMKSRLFPAGSRLGNRSIYIDDTAAIKLKDIRREIRKLARKEHVGLVVVDYMQIMGVESRRENRTQDLTDISGGLKAIAKDFNIPVIALSQLNRAVETRGGDKRPALSDLRDSGAIEQDADVVIFVYRPEYYLAHLDPEDPKRIEAKGKCELIISKLRNGPTGVVKLHFNPALTKFSNLAHPDRFPEPTNVTGERQDELPF